MSKKKIIGAGLIGLVGSVYGELIDQQDWQIDETNRKTSSCALSTLIEQSSPLDIQSLSPVQQKILHQLADQVKENLEEVYNPSLILESLLGNPKELSFGKVYAKWTKAF